MSRTYNTGECSSVYILDKHKSRRIQRMFNQRGKSHYRRGYDITLRLHLTTDANDEFGSYVMAHNGRMLYYSNVENPHGLSMEWYADSQMCRDNVRDARIPFVFGRDDAGDCIMSTWRHCQALPMNLRERGVLIGSLETVPAMSCDLQYLYDMVSCMRTEGEAAHVGVCYPGTHADPLVIKRVTQMGDGAHTDPLKEMVLLAGIHCKSYDTSESLYESLKQRDIALAMSGSKQRDSLSLILSYLSVVQLDYLKKGIEKYDQQDHTV